jgi:probable addiction module antidote protein
MNASVSYESNLIHRLREDATFAQIYLEEAMNDADTPDGKAVLLTVLRQLVEAQGDMTQLAESSGIKREALYRALSPKGKSHLDHLDGGS